MIADSFGGGEKRDFWWYEVQVEVRFLVSLLCRSSASAEGPLPKAARDVAPEPIRAAVIASVRRLTAVGASRDARHGTAIGSGS